MNDTAVGPQMKWLEDISKKQFKPISEIELSFDEVLTGTGPSAFTITILAEMAAQTGQPLNWLDNFHNMTEARQVGSILVLPVQTFAAGQGHSNSGDHNHELALVRYHYHASQWPKKHPRYSHPAYAGFDSKPQEEKERLIKEHEMTTKEKIDKEEAEKAAEAKADANRKTDELLASQEEHAKEEQAKGEKPKEEQAKDEKPKDDQATKTKAAEAQATGPPQQTDVNLHTTNIEPKSNTK
ncbi:hypothetical protein G7Y89_g6887 [Cudoniella acicularis]|uniref:Uncharacterized protein n=1 Tax=Cudoniella acicularis TaxID=354080 RepID=A0A8H4RJK3_9HELO|nr:hypothetical protein G7Y89_g6887 [Cudoniella acicularis]